MKWLLSHSAITRSIEHLSVLVSPPHIFIQGIDAQPIVRVAGLRWVTGENWLGDLEALSDGPWWFTRMEDCREMLDFSLTFFISFIKRERENHPLSWISPPQVAKWISALTLEKSVTVDKWISHRFFGRGFRGGSLGHLVLDILFTIFSYVVL